VRAVPYDLAYDGVWTIERSSVEHALGPRTRALLVVSPNNPTGSMLKAPERAWLDEACAARGVALVADEVFADYPVTPDPEAVRGVLGPRPERVWAPAALTFSLGGLSKSVGLPQVKVAWIATGGPPALVDAALARLEVICDTYLSVSTPAQLALGRLLDHGRVVRDAIRARLVANLERLSRSLATCPACSVLRVEGGWSAVVRVPATQPEERLVLALLDEDGVLAHPGYFFDFRHEAFLVVSLLTPPDVLQEGAARIARRMAG